ncbi:MAG: hypothetical protein HDS85_05475, partial [Bacteroidales bacterium]|nr:hypothetical protein [Bacteroidales bacterium]
MTDKCPCDFAHRLLQCTYTSEEIAGGFLFVPEHRRGKQLRGFRLMPFAERFGVLPYVVDN